MNREWSNHGALDFNRDYKRKTVHVRESTDKSRMIVPKRKIIINENEQHACVKKANVENFMNKVEYSSRRLHS